MRRIQIIMLASVAFCALVAIGIGGTKFAAHAQAPKIPTVTVADLVAAKFTNPVVQSPTSGGYAAPMVYFHVKESVTASTGWPANDLNLVAVNILPTPFVSTLPTDGPVVENYSGRVSVCDYRPGAYICVIGPDQTKGLALLNILKTK